MSSCPKGTLAALILLTTCTSPSGRAQPFDFQAPRQVITESGWNFGEISGITSVDLDGDGDSDVALVTQDPSRIRIYVNDGNGFFSEPLTLNRSAVLGGMTAGDFVKGGPPELAISQSFKAAHFVGIYRVDLDSATPLTLLGLHAVGGIEPRALVSADFDEDGCLDIAVCHRESFSVSVLLGDGVGGLDPPFVVNDLGIRPEALVAEDLDDDGHLDLAVVNGDSNNVALLRGHGDGSLQTYRFLPVGTAPRGIASGDVDGDGHTDLVITASGSDQLTVLRGDGAGEFTEGQTAFAGFEPNAVRLFDFDEDGELDAFVTSAGDHQVQWFRNVDGELVHETSLRVGRSPRFLLIDDFDRDGNPDLLTGNQRYSRSSTTLILGDGTLGFVSELVHTVPNRLFDFVTGDLNGDDLDDLLSVDRAVTDVLLGDGQGSFVHNVLPILASSAVLADMNEDGDLDLITVNTDGLGVHIGDGEGDFGTATTIPVLHVHEVVTGDLNADGFLDFAALTGLGFDGELIVILGDGAGGVLSIESTPVGFYPRSVELGDFDGDDLVDAVVLFADRISFHYGVGYGLPDPPVVVGGFDDLRTLGTGDFDEDGLSDIVLSNPYADELTVVLGAQDRLPTPLPPIETPTSSRILVADFDVDGHLDLVTQIAAPAGEYGPQLFRGLGTGKFAREGNFWIRDLPRHLACFDFDGDDRLDLVATSDGGCSPSCGNTGSVVVLRNRSLDHLDSRTGNVNATAGPIADVLFLNASAGTGRERLVEVARGDPLTVEILAPPSRQMRPRTNYALYAFKGPPRPSTVELLPSDVGRTCRSTPLTGGDPLEILSTLGRPGLFGRPTFPADPAPVVLSRPQGVQTRLTLTVFGLIADEASPSGILAVTNTVVLKVR